MANSQIKLKINGTDATAGAFKSVNKNIADTSKNASALNLAKGVAMGQALFSTVSGIASKAISAAAELGTLSDRAQQMGTSAVYAQKLEQALNNIGIKGVNLDTLSKAFSDMQRTTGKAGEEGFKSVLTDMSKIENEQERLIELSRIFGAKMGPNLAPLVRQGPAAFTEGLDKIMAGLPAVSDEAVNAGDSIADAFSTAGNHIKVSFQEAVGQSALLFEETFGISFEEGLLTLVENVKWAFKVAWEFIKVFSDNVKLVVKFFSEDWKAGLKWVWNGIVEWGKAWWQYIKDLFSAIGTIAKEFGKAFLRWITGDDADWSGAFDKSLAAVTKTADSYKKMLAAMIPEAPPGHEWAKVDMESLKKLRNERLQVVRDSLKAKAEISTSAVESQANIAEKGKEAAKKISDALKDAQYISAGSNDALKLALQGRSKSLGFSAPGTKNAQSLNPNSSGSKDNEILMLMKKFETYLQGINKNTHPLTTIGVV